MKTSKQLYISLIFIVTMLMSFSEAWSQQTVVPFGSTWKYFDRGSMPAVNWIENSYDDSAWGTGGAELGYGDGDEETVISYGSNPLNKFISYYFRKVVNLSSVHLNGYKLGLKRDDGAIVYLNGKEVFRSNIKEGPIFDTILAWDSGDDGRQIQWVYLVPDLFKTGDNLLAVEVHQSSISSSDLSFDLQLQQTTQVEYPILIRGPYLTKAMLHGIQVQCKTNFPSKLWVKTGTEIGVWTTQFTDSLPEIYHNIKIVGLNPGNKYFYSIGVGDTILQQGTNHHIHTLENKSNAFVRFLVLGDVGTERIEERKVHDAYLNFAGNAQAESVLLLGDNAYNEGTFEEYQSRFFDFYQRDILKNHSIWPAPGNHDYANSAARQADHNIPYFQLFDTPKLGESGGVPSNNASYYSFNQGSAHIISLDSYGLENNKRFYDTLSPQVVWMKQDLAQCRQIWKIVVFHHPPYTKGSHDSDTEQELIKIRQFLVPIFERYGVDLVLSGHSHAYERSHLIQGHYGNSNSFAPLIHKVQNGGGTYSGETHCAFVKNAMEVRNGIVYAVVGSSGKSTITPARGYPHKAMYFSNHQLTGCMILDIEQNKLCARWLGSDSIVHDSFTVFKNVNLHHKRLTSFTVPNRLSASWKGTYRWSTGDTSRFIGYLSYNNEQVMVADEFGCLADTFSLIAKVSKNESDQRQTTAKTLFIPHGNRIQFENPESTAFHYELFRLDGKTVEREYSSSRFVSQQPLTSGYYFLSVSGSGKKIVYQFFLE